MLDMDVLDERFSRLLAAAELEGTTCGLKHSKEDPAENHPAVDYLCQYLGDMETGIADTLIQIPICAECVDALCGKEWILFYCLKCNSSQWVKRTLARKSYPANMNIMFYDECPNCFEVI